jgi:4-alpha-glucanotransferase
MAVTRAGALKHTGGKEDTIHQDMIRLAFSSHSALAVAPMQDFLGLGSDARMNTPGTTRDNWRWRMTADQWNTGLSERIRELVSETSRDPEKRLDCTT